jgi:hypothetical protein
LDVHAASTTFAVIGESGKRLTSHVVETNGQALVEQLKMIPGSKHVCLEEGTQSAWVYEILSPHATEVVVTMVPESRGQKDDQRDVGVPIADFTVGLPPRSADAVAAGVVDRPAVSLQLSAEPDGGDEVEHRRGDDASRRGIAPALRPLDEERDHVVLLHEEFDLRR